MKDEKRLSELRIGCSCSVRRLEICGDMRRRFLDIGLLPGTRVLCIGESPFADPKAYCVRGKVIAIRSTDARGVIID